MVYGPPPKPRRHLVVIGVILFLLLVGALVFGALRLTAAAADTGRPHGTAQGLAGPR
ncbi:MULTISPECIES: hypothetical protein [unclassified Nonomuraea]|uniref:hypothetical protein n=1 Tax=Nonomuraea sp. NPDC003804 TaxID=3154547 RepID=UPI0033BA3ED4